MITLVESEFVDVGMAKVVNQCFLTLVYNNYWKLIEQGKLRPGSPECNLLLTSVRVSLSPYRADLTDFKYMIDKMPEGEEEEAENAGPETKNPRVSTASHGNVSEPIPGCVAKIVTSSKFMATIAIAILLNSIVVCVEELGRTAENDDHKAWLILDGIFTSVFVVEFVLKFSLLKLRYFKDAWNKFDFFLVVVGVLGFVLSVVTQGGSAQLAGQTRVMRLARVLRTMRFLRLFRLFHARMSADKFVSLELAVHMKKITSMSCFINAHLMAQNDLVKYFGGNGKLDESDEAEIARCILQSQVSTYRALVAAAGAQRQISPDILKELQTLYQRKTITEGLGLFVVEAHQDGAISAIEAHAILHPLNHQVSACMKSLNDRAEGVVKKGCTSETLHSQVTGHLVSHAARPASVDIIGHGASAREEATFRSVGTGKFAEPGSPVGGDPSSFTQVDDHSSAPPFFSDADAVAVSAARDIAVSVEVEPLATPSTPPAGDTTKDPGDANCSTTLATSEELL